jgi:hypothetical protein
MLDKLSKMAQDDQWRKKVLSAKDPLEITGIIDRWDA